MKALNYIVDLYNYKVLTKATVSIETNGQGIQKYIQRQITSNLAVMFLSSSFRLIFLSRRSSSLAVSSLTGIIMQKKVRGTSYQYFYSEALSVFSLFLRLQDSDLITAIFPCLVLFLKLSSMLFDYPIKCKKVKIWQLMKALRVGEKQCGYSYTLPSPCTAFFLAFKAVLQGKLKRAQNPGYPPQ